MTLAQSHRISPFYYKRKSFEPERELRASFGEFSNMAPGSQPVKGRRGRFFPSNQQFSCGNRRERANRSRRRHWLHSIARRASGGFKETSKATWSLGLAWKLLT